MRSRPFRSVVAAALTALVAGSLSAVVVLPANAAPATASGSVVTGIDVSGWQHPEYSSGRRDPDSIDWAKVAGSGHQFAIIKATEGTGFVNPYYATDRARARANGLVVGAYHFAKPALPIKTAGQQARHFVRTTGNLRTSHTLPPVLDIETTGGLTKKQVAKWSQRWLDVVEELTGRTPIIYSYDHFLRSSVGQLKSFARYPLWYARYTSNPAANRPQPAHLPGAWANWSVWQYSSTGRVPGIQGDVDLNWFNGTRANLLALADGTGQGTYPPDAPVSLTTGVTGHDVRLTWAAPYNNGGGTISSYAVHVNGVLDGYSPTRSYVAMDLGPGTHRLEVRAVNAAGSGPGASTTVTLSGGVGAGALAPPAATAATLALSTRVGSGTSQDARLTLRRADTQQTLPRRQVDVKVTPTRGQAFTRRLVTDAHGNATLPVGFRTHTTVEVAYAGTPRLLPSRASSAVRVTPTMTHRINKAKMRQGKRTRVVTWVDPLHRGSTVQLRKKTAAGTWKLQRTKKVRKNGRVRFNVRPKVRKTHRFRTYVLASDHHLKKRSATMKVRVIKKKKR